ncbi:glycosyltransferase family 2 protein [bacterium]|jgi:glycosyltransferase involved in cell wall biosynthesis|nr:glycosyltransferase family 2 protein [archaeon]MBT7992340.1 glycosyltransferase family 2 protein [bacterium]
MQKVIFFIPVFNEAERLGSVLSRLPKKVLDYETEIVIVDDCSSDHSVQIASDFTRHVVVLSENRGVGVATKVGFEYIVDNFSDGYIVKLDGDGQHELNFIPEIVRRLKVNDIVVCSRFHPSSDQTNTPVDRILLNMIFTEMLKKITGWDLTDVRSGFMGLRFAGVKSIASSMIVERYGIPMEILLRLWHNNPSAVVYEIPHPAIYGGDISKKLRNKYSSEKINDKSDRLQVAYSALLKVIESLKVPRERILKINGFRMVA